MKNLLFTTFTKTAQLTEGRHMVKLKINNVGFNVDKIVLKQNFLTSIDTDMEVRPIKIYPNPSHDGNLQLSQTTEWKVYNMQGLELKSGNSNAIHLSKGTFLIRTKQEMELIVVE